MKKPNEILFEKIDLLLGKYINISQILDSQGGSESKSNLKDYILTSNLDDIFHNNIDYEKIRERKVIDGSISFAEKNLTDDDYHKFLLELSKILADSNKTDLAEEVLSNLIDKPSSDNLKAESLLLLSDIFIRKAYWNKSTALIDHAKEIFYTLNNNIGLAKCENLYGTLHGEKGDALLSKGYFEKGIKLLQNFPDEKLEAELETNIGIIESIRGNLNEAKERFYNALGKVEKLKDNKKIAELHHNIGMLFLELKDYEKAITEFDKSLDISTKENYKTILSVSYLGKANTLLCLGNYNETAEYSFKAMDIALKIDDKLTIADVYKIIGVLEQKLNNDDIAEKYLQISLRLNKDLDNKLNSAETAFELALVYDKQGNGKQKNHWLNESLNYYKLINAKQKMAIIEGMLQTGMN